MKVTRLLLRFCVVVIAELSQWSCWRAIMFTHHLGLTANVPSLTHQRHRREHTPPPPPAMDPDPHRSLFLRRARRRQWPARPINLVSFTAAEAGADPSAAAGHRTWQYLGPMTIDEFQRSEVPRRIIAAGRSRTSASAAPRSE
jgi:hypothetical protein